MNKKITNYAYSSRKTPKNNGKLHKVKKRQHFILTYYISLDIISLDIHVLREHFEKLALGNESGDVSDTNGELYTSENNVYYDIIFFVMTGKY